MNAVQIHLVMNHVPVVAPVVAGLLLVIGLVVKSEPVIRTGLLTLIAAALLALPVYFTGEPVEKVAEKLPGVAKSSIETHESAAKATVVLLGLLGAGSIAALVAYRRRALPVGVGGAMLAICLVAAAQVAWTAHLGGQIRHTELTSGAAGGSGGSEGGGEAGERGGDDD